jgi:hypothetical protein
MAVGQGARIVLAGCHRTVRYVMCELLYGEQVLINGLYGDSGAGYEDLHNARHTERSGVVYDPYQAAHLTRQFASERVLWDRGSLSQDPISILRTEPEGR